MDNSEPESSEDSELYEQLAGEWNPMPKRCCALIIILIASPHLSENIPLFLNHQSVAIHHKQDYYLFLSVRKPQAVDDSKRKHDETK